MQSYCCTCLNKDISNLQLEVLKDVFNLILPEFTFDGFDCTNAQTCWDCRSVLETILKFRETALRSRDYLIGQSLGTHNEDVNKQPSPQTSGQNETVLLPVYYEEKPSPQVKSECEDTGKDFEDIADVHYGSPDFNVDEISDDFKPDSPIKEELDEPTISTKTRPNSTRKTRKRKQATLSELHIVKEATEKQLNFKRTKIKDAKPTYKEVPINSDELKSLLLQEKESYFFKRSAHKCKSCLLVFSSDELLMYHEKKMHAEDKTSLICGVCDSRFSHKSEMISHCGKHYHKYVCNECSYECASKRHINWHLKDQHKFHYECIKCGDKFGNRREFQHHHRSHSMFSCDSCAFTCDMKFSMERHVRLVHAEHVCTECGKKYATRAALWVHTKVKHINEQTDRQRRYCVECDKEFKHVYAFRQHLLYTVKHNVHFKKRVECGLCGKNFANKTLLKYHHAHAHLNLGHQCDLCDKRYQRTSDLKKHKRLVHEGAVKPRDKMCPYCGKGFTSKGILEDHMRTHTGERPFSCELCAATFRQQAGLYQHTKLVHKKLGKKQY